MSSPSIARQRQPDAGSCDRMLALNHRIVSKAKSHLIIVSVRFLQVANPASEVITREPSRKRISDINWGLKQSSLFAVACSPQIFTACKTGFVLFGHARLTNSLSIPALQGDQGGFIGRVRQTELL